MDTITRLAQDWFQKTMQQAMPDPVGVVAWVDRLRKKNLGRSAEELAEIAIAETKRKAYVIGVLAGLPSNPLLAAVLAYLELRKLIHWQVEMTAKIAEILAPGTLQDQRAFEADVLAVLIPQAVDEELELAARTSVQIAVGNLATTVARNASRLAIRSVISKGTLKLVKRLAARYLGVKLTQRVILARSVPLAGAAVGLVMNHYEITRTGRNALAYYRPKTEPLAP